jgi:hypothetical protein
MTDNIDIVFGDAATGDKPDGISPSSAHLPSETLYRFIFRDGVPLDTLKAARNLIATFGRVVKIGQSFQGKGPVEMRAYMTEGDKMAFEDKYENLKSLFRIRSSEMDPGPELAPMGLCLKAI